MITLILVSLLVCLFAHQAVAGRISPDRERVVQQLDWQWRYTVWMPKHWQNLAACESGSNPPNWTHHSFYEGAFGFAPGSWDAFKPVSWWPNSAHLASPWQQYQTALRVAARYGIAEPWGCWRGSQHAWVRNGLPEYGTRR